MRAIAVAMRPGQESYEQAVNRRRSWTFSPNLSRSIANVSGCPGDLFLPQSIKPYIVRLTTSGLKCQRPGSRTSPAYRRLPRLSRCYSAKRTGNPAQIRRGGCAGKGHLSRFSVPKDFGVLREACRGRGGCSPGPGTCREYIPNRGRYRNPGLRRQVHTRSGTGRRPVNRLIGRGRSGKGVEKFPLWRGKRNAAKPSPA